MSIHRIYNKCPALTLIQYQKNSCKPYWLLCKPYWMQYQKNSRKAYWLILNPIIFHLYLGTHVWKLQKSQRRVHSLSTSQTIQTGRPVPGSTGDDARCGGVHHGGNMQPFVSLVIMMEHVDWVFNWLLRWNICDWVSCVSCIAYTAVCAVIFGLSLVCCLHSTLTTSCIFLCVVSVLSVVTKKDEQYVRLRRGRPTTVRRLGGVLQLLGAGRVHVPGERSSSARRRRRFRNGRFRNGFANSVFPH